MQTREQRYAKEVFKQVQQVPPEQHEGYKSAAQGLAALIRSAGLAQALAFTATQDAAHQKLLQDLAVVVGITSQPGQESIQELVKRSLEIPLGEYMRLTWQINDALLWYKRFAEALFK